MSNPPVTSGQEGVLRAVLLVLAVIALLLAATGPSFLIAHVVELGGQQMEAVAQSDLTYFRWAAAGAGLLLLLLFLWRPLAADVRSYRRRRDLAEREGADASRILGEIEGRPLAAVVVLTLLGFAAYTFIDPAGRLRHLFALQGATEIATALFYLMAAFLGFFEIARQTLERRRVGLQRWLLVPLVALFVFIAGEETGWGDAYFNYASPATAAAPAETPATSGVLPLPFLTSEGNWALYPVSADLVLRWVAGTLGILLPLLMRAFPSLARWLWAVGVPLPSGLVQAGFAMVALIPSDAFLGGWLGSERVPNELRQLLFAGLCFVVIWQALRSNCADDPAPAPMLRL